MITKTARALLESLVDACVSQRIMFTAYSLTVAIRNTNEFLLHEDSRRVVHKMYDDGTIGVDYTRSMVDLGGAKGACYVYHHRADDPCAYVDLVANAMHAAQADAALRLAQKATRRSVHGSSNSPLPYFARRSQNERVTRSRKRISIPNAVVRQAGFAMGTTVYVGYNIQAGTYTYERQRPAPGTYDFVGVTHVDKSDNIRHHVGRAAAQQFRISVTPHGCIQAVAVTQAQTHMATN
jgi:hypothetical protein